MITFLIAIVVAIAGVGLFALLVQRVPSRAVVRMLAPGVVLLGLAGIGMLQLLPVNGDENATRVLTALVLLWVGWIGLMVLLAHMLNRRMPGTYPLPSLAAGLATLAPVIGFLLAGVIA